MAFLQFHATHSAGLLATLDTLTHTILPSCVNSYKYYISKGPLLIGINKCRMFNPNNPLFLFVLPSLNFLDQSKITSESMDVCPSPDTYWRAEEYGPSFSITLSQKVKG